VVGFRLGVRRAMPHTLTRVGAFSTVLYALSIACCVNSLLVKTGDK
jgi:hypothetical protein